MKKKALLVTALLMLTVIFCSGCGKTEKVNSLFNYGLAPFLDCETNLWGFVNPRGEMVIAPRFDGASGFDDTGLALVELNNKCGYIDKTGKYVINPRFDSADIFADNGLATAKLNDKWEYIDRTGKYVINPRFDDADSFVNGLARVEINGKYGYIDKTGKYVVTPQFDYAGSFADNGLARVKLNGKYGYIDKTGKYVINPQFDTVLLNSYDDGYSVVYYEYEDEKTVGYGIVDESGNFVALSKNADS